MNDTVDDGDECPIETIMDTNAFQSWKWFCLCRERLVSEELKKQRWPNEYRYHLILKIGHPILRGFCASEADDTTIIVVHAISLRRERERKKQEPSALALVTQSSVQELFHGLT